MAFEQLWAECERLQAQVDALREENARLRGYMRPDQIEEAETVMKLIKERDEARAEVRRIGSAATQRWDERDRAEAEVARFRDEVVPQVEKKRHDAMAEVSRLEAVARTAEASRRAHIERAEDFQKEIERLEGLILAWDRECGPDELLEAEARRIRAQREEGKP